MWRELEVGQFCLAEWVEDYAPSEAEELAVLVCMDALVQEPRPDESVLTQHARGVFPEGRRIDVPGTNVVTIWYAIYDDLHAIGWLFIGTFTP